MDDGLEMEGVREEVGESDGVDGVSGGEEGAEIAGESCGIAGDVDDGGRADGGEERGDVWAEAGARRVENDEVGNYPVGGGGDLGFGVLAEEVECGCADCGAGGVAEIFFERRRAAEGCRLNCNYLVEGRAVS